MDRNELFGSFEFDPEQSIPSDVPQPWYVAGYAFKAVDSVLRIDYLAQRIRHSRSVYEVPGGQITYIGHPEELRGTPLGVGTLHILWPPGHDVGTTLGRIIEEAHQRGIKMRDLPSGKREPAQ